jgi:DNA-binding LytR/AlgR family response regulator
MLAGPMNGRDVADHARIRRPCTPILFTSGHAWEAVTHNQRPERDVELLPKPFSYAALAAKVRSCLRYTSVA